MKNSLLLFKKNYKYIRIIGICLTFLTVSIVFINNCLNHKPKELSEISQMYILRGAKIIYPNLKDKKRQIREPAYPFFLSLIIKSNISLNYKKVNALLTNKNIIYSKRFFIVRIWQITLLWFVLILILLQVLKVSRNWMAVIFLGGLLCWSGALREYVSIYRPEILAMFWFVICIISQTYFYSKKNNYFLAFLIGLFWGILALNKAIFLYIVPINIIIMGSIAFFYKKQDSNNLYTIIKSTSIFLLSFFIVVGSYMTKTYLSMGSFIIAERSGIILDVRANMNQMTLKEYVHSFNCWRVINTKATLVKTFSQKFCQNLTNIHSRSRKNIFNDTYIDQAYQTQNNLRNIFGRIEAGEHQYKLAKQKIIAQPMKHLLVTIPLMWRGGQIENKVFLWEEFNATFMNVLFYLSLLLLLFLGFKNKDIIKLSITIPPFLVWIIHALISPSIPRFNVITLPIMYLILTIIIFELYEYLKNSLVSLK